jgi:putative transcriptional regulator
MGKAFDSIKQGLDEALEFSKGKKGKAVVHEFAAVDVKNIRAKVGMSQNEFASAFGISVSTLRHWERSDRTPHGPL